MINWRYSPQWQTWIPEKTPDQPLPELAPLATGPLEPEHQCDDPRCLPCWNAGQRYADYLKQRALETW